MDENQKTVTRDTVARVAARARGLPALHPPHPSWPGPHMFFCPCAHLQAQSPLVLSTGTKSMILSVVLIIVVTVTIYGRSFQGFFY
eukprot:SAG31_NODE_5410_length_2551_cov_5.787928_2_plen_86_part_00